MKWYRQGLAKALAKTINYTADTLVWTLHTSTYAPSQDTHVFVSDLTNELAAGSGYTQGTASGGGLAIASPTVGYTTANSWSVLRANTTAYNVDDVVRPSTGNGFLYRCAVAGTSASSAPTYSTVLGRETADGSAVWETAGVGATILGCTDPVWATFSAGPCRFAVLSDRTPGVNASDPLLGYVDFVTDRTGGGGNFTINLHATLRALHIFAV